MGILDKIKSEVAKTGANKGKFLFFQEGKKVRIRFLSDLEDAVEIVFHDSFEQGINVPCQEAFGKNCPYCGDDSLKTRSKFAWPVYDYEAKEVKILMAFSNNCSPVPALAAMYETYGTLLDRDYVLTVTGKAQNKSFSVIPMDKNKFRNTAAKALSKSAILKMVNKAYPCDDVEDEDDDYEEEPKRKAPKKQGKKKPEPEYDEDEDEFDEEMEDEELDYSDMSAKELYKLCKERDIDVLPKKPVNYYVKQLEAYDQASDDWEEDEDDEDEWEDE